MRDVRTTLLISIVLVLLVVLVLQLTVVLDIRIGGAHPDLILGLAIAIEEVAKYSNTCALMLLLTRLPTGPVLIAGSEEQKQRYLPGIAAGSQRSGFGLSESGAGSR